MNWPAERTCPFDESSSPRVAECWERSRGLMTRLRNELFSAGVDRIVRSIYVSGSLGRMEAVASSDCDLVVILSEADRAAAGDDVMETVFDCIARTGFQPPKRGGIFGSPTSFEELLDDATAGKIDEDAGVFGKRIQALLDSQPLLHPDEFEALQLAILTRYASAPVADTGAFLLGWLVDDLVRYWRSLCARTRWLCHDDVIQWRCLNAKLRHSRMLLCAGLFRLLLDVRSSDDPVRALLPQLKNVPLERVARMGSRERDELVRGYEVFMAAMSNGLAKALRDDHSFDNLVSNGVALSEAIGQACSEQYGDAMFGGWFGELR